MQHCKLLVNQAKPQSENLCKTHPCKNNLKRLFLTQNPSFSEHHPLEQHEILPVTAPHWKLPKRRICKTVHFVCSNSLTSPESEMFGNWVFGTQKLHNGFLCRWMLSAKRRFRFVGICKLQRSIPMPVLRSGHRSDKNKGQTHVMAKCLQTVVSLRCFAVPMFGLESKWMKSKYQTINFCNQHFLNLPVPGWKKNHRSFKVGSAFNSRSNLTWSLSHVLAAWVVPMHEHLHHLNMASHDIDESIHVRCRHII